MRLRFKISAILSIMSSYSISTMKITPWEILYFLVHFLNCRKLPGWCNVQPIFKHDTFFWKLTFVPYKHPSRKIIKTIYLINTSSLYLATPPFKKKALYSWKMIFGTKMFLTKWKQIRILLRNKTGIESWIVEKANWRRKEILNVEEKYSFPYDLGWRRNVWEVFGSKPESNGCYYPVIDGASQFSLTGWFYCCFWKLLS